MANRRRGSTGPDTREPDLSPEQALLLLRRQHERLQDLKGKNWKSVKDDEDKWTDMTWRIVARAFGDPSLGLSQFHQARHAGVHNIMGISDTQAQRNYELRMREFENVLANSIEELGIDVPADPEGAYQPGQQYEFYRDLSARIAQAKREVFVVDPYLDEEHFNLYVQRIPPAVSFRALVDITKVKPNAAQALKTASEKYAASKPKFEIRGSSEIHDRLLFVDDHTWTMGQSLKDAATSKATYIIEFNGDALREFHEDVWNRASSVI